MFRLKAAASRALGLLFCFFIELIFFVCWLCFKMKAEISSTTLDIWVKLDLSLNELTIV